MLCRPQCRHLRIVRHLLTSSASKDMDRLLPAMDNAGLLGHLADRKLLSQTTECVPLFHASDGIQTPPFQVHLRSQRGFAHPQKSTWALTRRRSHCTSVTSFLSCASCIWSCVVTKSSLWCVGSVLISVCLAAMKLGGGTGLVGDPSMRMDARDGMPIETATRNLLAIQRQLDNFFSNATPQAEDSYRITRGTSKVRLLNNADWLNNISFMDFLKVTGKMKVRTMLSRDRYAFCLVLQTNMTPALFSMKNRQQSSEGLNYSELTYQLLQAYDFFHLNKAYGIELQVGGSDQWGNIVAGLDLIQRNRLNDDEAPKLWGLTTPLLATASGEKFGKSAGNAVWLDPRMTSVLDFFQVCHQCSHLSHAQLSFSSSSKRLIQA